MHLESSGLLEGRYFRARRADVTGAIFSAIGVAGFVVGVEAASGQLYVREDRLTAGGVILAAVVLVAYGVWRLWRGPIRERHHYTPWVRSSRRGAGMH